jgi:hypothetical protein
VISLKKITEASSKKGIKSSLIKMEPIISREGKLSEHRDLPGLVAFFTRFPAMLELQ